MVMAPRLDLRQSQTLKMTPQLMQSIRLLALSHVELEAFVSSEIECNPLLERAEAEPDISGITEADKPDTSPDGSAHIKDSVENFEHLGSAVAIAGDLDAEVGDIFPEQVAQDAISQSLVRQPFGALSAGQSGPDGGFEALAPSPTTLREHLGTQVALILGHPADRLIGAHLIDGLNEAGYLEIGLDVIAARLGTEEQEVEAVLGAIQGCDPLGVFARNVAECLAIQLRDRDRLDPLMETFLQNLVFVEKYDLAGLARKIGAGAEDIADMVAEIRKLDPRPGLSYAGITTQMVVPDVFVTKGRNGAWQLELNSEALPKVLVNRTYYASVSAQSRNGRDKSYLADCLQTANWLIRSLDQRAQTILKVSAEIIVQQADFLEHGVTHLRPMTLKMVADAIEMHESTVSRVTASKYLATPRGLLEMKYFFTTALGAANGGTQHSAEAVRHRIGELIAAEKAGSVLSDDTIAAMLQQEQGIEIARRTVAKYREAMGLGSSVIRRRQLRAAQF
ncbi:MAG: RNA polymerase factor sigma-54 [Alphaproteobacteria bacterium]|nr:RNA polymerase factor sigma-54 [Alphaproteobacteria bacterium]